MVLAFVIFSEELRTGYVSLRTTLRGCTRKGVAGYENGAVDAAYDAHAVNDNGIENQTIYVLCTDAHMTFVHFLSEESSED